MAGNAVTAAEWKPERNVEIVVAVSPGGGQDKTARLVQRLLVERRFTDVPVNVVNRPGGGGTIGWSYVNQRAGDAHVLTVGNTTLLTNHIVGRTAISYTDVSPLAILLAESVAISVREDSPIKTGRDLIERLRRDAGTVSASIGNSLGGINHLALVMVTRAAGGDPRRLKAVVFQGGGDAMTALLGGHVDVVSSAANNVIGHVAAGKVRVIGIAASQRLAGSLASAPIWREQGADVVFSNWRLVAGPRGLTPQQIAYWEAALAKVVETDEWKKDLAQNDFEGLFLKSQETERHLKAQHEQFRAALAEIGMAK